MENKYFLGLDLGTSSIGWSVTDENYNTLKFKGQNMMGVHLFEEAKTAEERRIFRSARRRLRRRSNRIKILREFFAEEISKVDPGFYQRLDDSFFYPDDKEMEQTNSLFNDAGFKDRDYHDKYKTIYHLRSDLVEKDEKFDIRLIYLAIHNILKYRGHFLFPGKTISLSNNLEGLLEELNSYIELHYLGVVDIDLIKEEEFTNIIEILSDKTLTSSDKDKELRKLLGVKNTDLIMRILKLSKGDSVDLKYLFYDLLNGESLKLTFKKDFEEFLANNESSLDEDSIELLNLLKLIYDSIEFKDIMGEEEYISKAKVLSYEKHKNDLKELKALYKKYLKDKYKDFFRGDESSYQKYIDGKIGQEDINKIISKDLKGVKSDDPSVKKFIEEADLYVLLPKQKISSNSTIPQQAHRAELVKILENASKYYEFLNEEDDNGNSVKEKILASFDFRIPYYVGPLSDKNKVEDGGFSWIVKKSNQRITPWNFEEVVDQEASAEKFIRNMTNTCSYLVGEDVLPKESLLYQEYEVLNEINNIKINNLPISKEYKDYIYEEFFLKKHRNLTKKTLEKELINNNKMQEGDILTGIDIKINSSLSSYHKLKEILGNKVKDKEKMENIILWTTLYNEAKPMLKKKLEKEYGGYLSKEEINKLSKLNFKNWGRLSRKLLTGIIPAKDKNKELEDISIIEAMRETNKNLMELLSNNYAYTSVIEEENKKLIQGESIEDLIEESYVSPGVKRMITRSITLIKEIEKIMEGQPEKVFIEMAREKEEIPSRKSSRKAQLLSLYKNIKEEERDWQEELSGYSDAQFRSKKLYLYYTQMGRCMYSGEKISIEDLFNRNLYDIDHIYPRSKTKDDSIINNLVLVKKTSNMEKGDKFPLPVEFQNKNHKFWYMLMKKGLISKEKYERLVRKTGFTPEELSNFISRQLVETRQSTKEVARILKYYFTDSKIVYVKAQNISEFRHKFDLLKVREINDYHHAHDAYLAIVVGNIYHSKFTSNPANYIRRKGGARARNYNLDKIFNIIVADSDGLIVWDPEKDIKKVKKTLDNKWLQFTRYSYTGKGGFYDQQPVNKEKASEGIGYYPLKTKDERFKNLARYGAYSRMKNAYFALVEHTKKNKIYRTIISIPIIYAKELEDKNNMEKYIKENLGMENPRILVQKIKYNSLFKINGFYYHIAGKSGESYQLRPAVQLSLDKKYHKLIRAIKQKLDGRPITIHQESLLEDKELLELYDKIIEKFGKTIYKYRRNPIDKILIEGRERFINLNTLEKCEILLGIIMNMNAEKSSVNLKNIGGSNQSGVVSISKNIDNNDEFIMINQSISGLFSNSINLLGEFNELENSSSN